MPETKKQEPCAGARKDFIDCVLKYSECVRKPGTTFKDCLKADVFPSECMPQRERLNLCKRSLVDRRFRLKGTKKLETSQQVKDDEE